MKKRPKKGISRQYRWQLEGRGKGRCRRCTKKISRRSRSLCDGHLLRERARMRIRLGYAPDVAARREKFQGGRKGRGNPDLRARVPGAKREAAKRKRGR